MMKRIILLIVIGVFLFGYSGVLLASEDYIASEIRYKLDGGSLTTVDIDDVTITFYDDGVAHAPVELYAFPEPLEGTLTQFDMYLTDAGDPSDAFWFCVETGGAQPNHDYFSGDGIDVTNDTADMYIGLRWLDSFPAIVTPGTE